MDVPSAFSASIETIGWFLTYFWVIVTSTALRRWTPPCEAGVNPPWAWADDHFSGWLDGSAPTELRGFASLFIDCPVL